MNTPAPLAPELAYKEDLHGKERTSQLKQAKEKVALEQDVVHNDFKREMLFYRQAQAAVLEGLPRLQSMKVGKTISTSNLRSKTFPAKLNLIYRFKPNGRRTTSPRWPRLTST